MKPSEEESLMAVLEELLAGHAKNWQGAIMIPMPQQQEYSKTRMPATTQAYTTNYKKAIKAWRKLIR